jgi:hypothetical protein
MTTYQTVMVDGIEVFYREAGPADAPTILLLHGFPSSSRRWEPLLIRLADTFHLVAPDYPGFGHSDVPDPAVFEYTFDHLAEIIDGFTTKLGLHALRPVSAGLRRTDRVQAGAGPPRADPGADRAERRRPRGRARAAVGATAVNSGLTAPNMRRRCAKTSSRPPRPVCVTSERAPRQKPTTRICGPMSSRFCSAPGQADIQTDLFFDCQTNVASYPAGRNGFALISRRCW